MNHVNNRACPCAHPCEFSELNSLLMQQGEPIRYKRGEVLWKQDDPADWMVAVCTGTIKLTREWPGGRDAILDLVHRGQLVGAGAALPDANHSSTCSVLAAGKGIRVHRSKLAARGPPPPPPGPPRRKRGAPTWPPSCSSWPTPGCSPS